jgi:Putative serine esterase (DUF676)
MLRPSKGSRPTPVTSSFRRIILSCLSAVVILVTGTASVLAYTISTETVRIGPSGGMLAADPVDVVVTIPPGALTRTIPVSVEVQSMQSRHVIDPGYMLSLHGVTLSLAPDALSESGSVAIRLPFVGTYDGTTPSLTMMMAEAKDGNRVALSATRSGESELTGQLDAATIQALDKHPADHGRVQLRLFTANGTLESGPFVWSVEPFLTAIGQFRMPTEPPLPLPPLSGRIALCVSGLRVDLQDLNALGAHLAAFHLPGTEQTYYSSVIGFQYTSNVHIDVIGDALAQAMQEVLTNNPTITQIDVYAHSLGNLVARWGIEQGNGTYRLGPLIGGGHYISLGGPHAGVPFGDLRLFQSFICLFPTSTKPILMDLATTGKDGPPTYTTFLTDLNPTNSPGPDYPTAHYYSVSANDWLAQGPIGVIINGLYFRAVPPLGTSNDGLVAVYSAQDPVLGRESQTWQPGITLHVSHHDLATDARDNRLGKSAFDIIDELITGWQ